MKAGRKSLVGGGIMLLVGVLVTTLALPDTESPEDWIRETYRADGDAYLSVKTPVGTANEVREELRPLDEVYDPAGVFLRYPGAVVAILPKERGSVIHVDGPDDGFRRWHVHVGARWGNDRLFRGGGPGGGGK
jgi:hypothetical protein